MPLLLPPPEVQFCDANGVPYAGGTVTTYVVGTDTFKNTWADNGGTVLNQNPITLDAAGRAIIFGDGDYRLVLKDQYGNLIYDQWTSSVVSDAMQPVVAAPTIAEAVTLLGISDMIQAETDRAEAAENTLTTNLNAEIARAEAAEATLTTDLNAEIARAKAAETALSDKLSNAIIQFGWGSTNTAGTYSFSFDTAYTYTPALTASVQGSGFTDVWLVVNPSTSGFTVTACTSSTGTSVVAAAITFFWIAVGN